MTKLRSVLVKAAVIGVATWGASQAGATITLSMQLDQGGVPSGISTMSYGAMGAGHTVVLDLMANISGPVGNTGLYYTVDNFVGTYEGTDSGAIKGVTLGPAFSGGFGLSQPGVAAPGGVNGSINWGDFTSTGIGNSFLDYSPLGFPVMAPVLADSNGDILLGQLTYTVNSLASGDAISLSFVVKDPGTNPGVLWEEGGAPYGDVLVSDGSGHSSTVGVVTVAPFTVAPFMVTNFVVPEPATVGLLGLGLVGLLGRRRK